MTPHENCLSETVLMKDDYIDFHLEIKVIWNFLEKQSYLDPERKFSWLAFEKVIYYSIYI